MAAPMEKTRHPGIYKRGSRYVVVYKVDGVQKKESARTLDAARRLKAARTADRDRGELGEQSRVKFRAYAEEWVERYQGNGRRGFTETTREDYRSELEHYAYPFFDGRLGRTLAGITPRDVAKWIGWLCEQPNNRRQAHRPLSAADRDAAALVSREREARRTDSPQPGRWRRVAAPAASRGRRRRARATGVHPRAARRSAAGRSPAPPAHVRVPSGDRVAVVRARRACNGATSCSMATRHG